MPRKKRRRADAATPAAREADRTASFLPEWRWRTFPVFFAFSFGLLVMAVLDGPPETGIALIARFAALTAVSYGLARIVVRKLFVERRVAQRQQKIGGGDPADDNYEDVVVYPNDDPPARR